MKPLSILVIVALAWAGLTACARAEKLEGRVHNEANNAGIAALTVKLKPPKGSKEAERLESTDDEGKFTFADVPSGRYLLEVSQGPRVLYRKEVAVPASARVEVPLRKSKQ
jgi:hypothetical protein